MIFAGALAAALALSAGVSDARAVVIVDDESKPYREAVRGLEGEAELEVEVERLLVDDPALAARLSAAVDERTLWLALGPRAAKRLAAASPRRRAAALLRHGDVPQGLAAVTLDARPADQLGWIKAAFPGRRQVIALRRPGGVIDDEALEAAALEAGLALVIVDAKGASEAVPAFEGALRSTSARVCVLWLVPDPSVLGADAIGPLVEEALAARVPVVGFSPYFLRVGALGAVETDHRAAARQALALARASTEGGAVVVAPPAGAHLVVNARLAERLGIAVAEGDGVRLRR